MKFGKEKGKELPPVSTASLPDIIFMLLFFFMVVTVMRDTEQKVQISVPEATELTKLEQKSLVNHIQIGRPNKKFQKQFGTSPRIQLNDKFAEISDIPLFLEQHRVKIPEMQRGRIRSSLKVDRDVTMGIVQDVKTQLRKSGQLAVNYSSRQKAE